jgi:hypothetical protein
LAVLVPLDDLPGNLRFPHRSGHRGIRLLKAHGEDARLFQFGEDALGTLPDQDWAQQRRRNIPRTPRVKYVPFGSHVAASFCTMQDYARQARRAKSQ